MVEVLPKKIYLNNTDYNANRKMKTKNRKMISKSCKVISKSRKIKTKSY